MAISSKERPTRVTAIRQGPWHGLVNTTRVVPAALPKWTGLSCRALMGVTLALYILNQKALLPKPLSAIVSKVLFWPTLPITIGRRIGKWHTEIDECVVMGGAPFGFAGIPEKLYRDYGVRGVINLCDEYEGPIQQYKTLGISHLRLPTIDHFCPSVEALEAAVRFVQEFYEEGNRVYVHCRAGHGRSAAAVYCWLLSKNPNVDRKALNEQLSRLRYVKNTLWKQPAIVEFHSRLLQQWYNENRGAEASEGDPE